MNAKHRRRAERADAPDANSEYLFYQTLLGIWPVARGAEVPNGKAVGALRERVEEYMLKAVKEAKLHTSWTDQNEGFENALKEFIASRRQRRRSRRSSATSVPSRRGSGRAGYGTRCRGSCST